ncbi:kinesin-domain-containing protein [Hortaea werneckii]|nr:kinesin-domain-containing protein [Hortaea werneckii]KAI7101553.1 kinesin-domain-containing protein [Hortaea werneckii]KAI7240892.1 kinesin-domain-containing protein [Hortaea werneckii]KAI7329564.1 kinesin-domain-containing protein [Hortaea werneckii]KAI7407507.1 kinesin-domain-containing protein [Hortaea werneckii]
MERPSSQLENVRPANSALPKPTSRLPMAGSSNGRTLLETSQSDLNARTKHKIPGLPESIPKVPRKTLAERAAEPIHPTRSHIPPPTTSKASAARAGLSNGYRNGSMRGPSHRPVGAARHARMPSAPNPAAAQFQDEEEEEPEVGVMGKRKGMPPPDPPHPATLALRKTRTFDNLRQQSLHPHHAAHISARSQHSGSYIRSASDSSSGQTASHSALATTSRQASGSSVATSSSHSAPPPTQPAQPIHDGVQPVAGQLAPSRNVSLSTAFAGLSLTPRCPPKHQPSLSNIQEGNPSPSKIPKYSCPPPPLPPPLRHTQSQQVLQTPSPLKHKTSLNGLSWDTKGRLEDMEKLYENLKTQLSGAADSKTAIEESLSLYKARVQELSQLNQDLSSSNKTLGSDLERARNDLHTTASDLRNVKRDHERDIQEVERKHERDLADVASKLEKEVNLLQREREKDEDRFKREMEDAKAKWQRAKDDETADLTTQHWEEMEETQKRHRSEKELLQKEVETLKSAADSRAIESADEVKELREGVEGLRKELEEANESIRSLKTKLSGEEAKNAGLEQEKASLVSKTHFLEGNQEAQSLEFTTMSEKLQDALTARNATLDTLRKEEMLRRKLNATILELRGNIRVFVRTRPLLTGEESPSRVEYPDQDSLEGGKEMVVHAPTTLSATGKERNEAHKYAFDRVFGPGSANTQVFEDCRDLIQSVVDGYNVSILSYGQTGSGKTFGMSGPEGIIPSSIGLLMAEMQRLSEKGWEYSVEASFVEVYNETINDLLGDAKTWDEGDGGDGSARGKKKERHEIHHDPLTGKTTVSNLSSVALWPPPSNDGQWPPPAPTMDTAQDATADPDSDAATSYTQKAIDNLLTTAMKNRRVASTKSNERSSRSHSIFMLTLKGSCAATNETSEGVLNLVDLAGSERLKQSGAAGERQKETAAINRSLSSLGDVIGALASGKGEAHVPYRNSKLTYLLQSSLGGTAANGKSSRTLMLLHLSPLAAHWQESRSSLLFGSKVLGAHIGSAKKK